MLHARITIDQAEQRRELRSPLSASLTLRELGCTAVEARLLNISSRGFMVATEALVEPGARLWLNLPGAGRTNGLVIWAAGGFIGGEFAEPVDPLAIIEAAGRDAA